MKVGDTVWVVTDPVSPMLRGLEGPIIGTEEFHGKTLFVIRAENHGRPMPTPRGTRPQRSWKPGDIRKLEGQYIEITKENVN